LFFGIERGHSLEVEQVLHVVPHAKDVQQMAHIIGKKSGQKQNRTESSVLK